jgi:hypothetical protein
MEYYDRTLYELSIEFEGYNVRWEEQHMFPRLLYTLLYNKDLPRGKQKNAMELFTFPSEKVEKEWQEKMRDMVTFEKLKRETSTGKRD